MINSIKRTGVTGLKVIVDKNELNKENDNSSTYIFKAFDAINNREIIIKIPKKLVDNQGKISVQEISEAEELAQTRFYSSCYACQMAYLFNQKLNESNLLNEMQPLFYAHPILYTLDKPFFGMTKVYGETFLQIQFKFEKYTTNSAYIEQNKYFYSAFSHFTYQISNKLLVIMDLQGCNNILSDPSIQTDQYWESDLDKDETNRKNKGIEEFKKTQHKDCSYLCKKLNLPEINQQSKINENKCPKELISNINGICYDCDEFVKGDMDQLNNLKDKKFKFNCNFCLTEQSNKINQECKCCNYIFQTPLNSQIKQLTNLGECADCKSKCLKEKQKNACYYCKRVCQKIMKQLNINDQAFYICENALEYLSAFRCKKCNKPYNRNSIISLEDYNGKSFSCC
ncbi:unnamed protein product (macronuclear) [Paramecium tetraurelia]|uniref:Alpha-type protein kinase domain-containing protein n=1 Tax=Paramecium tetraurelia TaxID=5888 RepID=A0BGU3_PARTE|nr:uncharacterized protein GSPATT00028795001 [Paramecium tetraurelia]CAK57760.1 unnamed protein product [Paramecium tetraurelia]|eukprot:XP_001425158.1 hypothetical protein (macronuclear) [Paramecium tetraurelia strain d4-2]